MKFKFRLDADDGSGEFRQGTVSAETKPEAKAILERREYRWTAYRVDEDGTEESAAELARLEAEEAKAAEEGRPAHGDVRSKLAIHRQEKPFKVVWIKPAPGEADGTDDSGEEA